MIRLSGRLICRTEAEAATVARALPAHVALTRAEPGCLRFEVTVTADPLIWRVEEAFTTRAAFDTHQTRTRASDWFRETADIARDYTVSED